MHKSAMIYYTLATLVRFKSIVLFVHVINDSEPNDIKRTPSVIFTAQKCILVIEI